MKRIAIILLFVFTQICGQNKTSEVGIDLIKYFEGYRSTAYKCPANVWTIGYGHTVGVKSGMVITETQAKEYLKQDLMSFEKYINKTIRRSLIWHEFDALSSFSYNLGFRLKGELRNAIEFGNTNLVTIKLRAYSKAKVNGKYVVLNGLLKRRDAESSLYDGSFTNPIIRKIMKVKN